MRSGADAPERLIMLSTVYPLFKPPGTIHFSGEKPGVGLNKGKTGLTGRGKTTGWD